MALDPAPVSANTPFTSALHTMGRKVSPSAVGVEGKGGVAEIRPQKFISIPRMTVSTKNATTILANEWGVNKVGAPSVWPSGNRGEGMVAATIDTGVRGIGCKYCGRSH